MRFLEKIDGHTFILHINVKPNSRKQDLIENDKFLTIYVRSKAFKNKANKELINLLKTKLEINLHHIKIVSGLKSTNKVVKLHFLEKREKQSLINKLFD
ncbi:MAG: DUF167 domain-containing protein [Candidatus Hodarchaeota archaeon]